MRTTNDAGFGVLNRIQKSREFSEFEKYILSSRFFRFASFSPFLKGERDLLRKEVDFFISQGRDAPVTTDHEQLIKHENHYAMLESAARAEVYFGNASRALDLVEEIASDIDPLDSRVWLQVGEYRNRLGNLHGALMAYTRAAVLGPPLRNVAWMLAGDCLQELGRLEEAGYKYILALRAYPNSTGPLERLEKLNQILQNDYFAEWCGLMRSGFKRGSYKFPNIN